jgi:short-subunit dehydrogenase
MEYFRDKAVLITGASAGIGQELARQLNKAGAKLTITARRKDRLDSLGFGLALQCDVTRDGDLDRAVAEGVRHWGKLDIVIANAGFGVGGPMKSLTVDDYRRQFETNVFGVLRTIYAALPEIEKNRGDIVIIGSVAGWVSGPGMAPYSMSKFALRALANSITPELRQKGVKVTLISPGFVESDIRRVDNQGNFDADRPDSVPPWLVTRKEKAALQILRAIARGKREAIITGHGKVLVALERWMPWLLRASGNRMARS